MPKPLIENVSDTALWVATYRAKESARPDALFQDHLAEKLAGLKGKNIAKASHRSMYVEWTVIIRTVVIDRFIQEQIKNGVDLVLNLGTGLDTRPYRLDLPASLRWIEVDFPGIIELKEKELASETPRCKLSRMKVDLSDPAASQKCFAEVASLGSKILVITEGVIPYLTNDQVAALGRGLHAHSNFHFWITEYLSPHVVKLLQNPKQMKHMQNAPFRFAPGDWNGFFKTIGWIPKETVYLSEESQKLGRPTPAPFFCKNTSIHHSQIKARGLSEVFGLYSF